MYLYLALAFFLTALSSCSEEEKKLEKDIQVISHDIEVFADDLDDSLEYADK